jgi:hypothetical protein
MVLPDGSGASGRPGKGVGGLGIVLTLGIIIARR